MTLNITDAVCAGDMGKEENEYFVCFVVASEVLEELCFLFNVSHRS